MQENTESGRPGAMRHGSMLERVGAALLELHRKCRDKEAGDFPGWAMELVRAAIAHDACFWGSGAVVDGEIVVHTGWFRNIPSESMQTWEQHKHADTCSAKLVANPGVVVNFTNAALQREYIYPRLFRPFGIEQLMGGYFFNETTGLYSAISLYRSDPEAAFSEEERQALQCLAPHLIETRRVNFLAQMLFSLEEGKPPRQHVAAADTKGVLHAVAEEFLNMLAREWPDWRGPRLPEALLAKLREGVKEYLGKAIAVRCDNVHDMHLLQIRSRTAVDGLSLREREVAQYFAKGRTHKNIAAQLDISPYTVRNHLTTIYNKLCIGSKAELAALLAKS